jgi:hypothetical protein
MLRTAYCGVVRWRWRGLQLFAIPSGFGLPDRFCGDLVTTTMDDTVKI